MSTYTVGKAEDRGWQLRVWPYCYLASCQVGAVKVARLRTQSGTPRPSLR
jgi:hypothetical protein